MPKKESKIHAKVQKFSDHLGLIVAIITSLSAIGGAGVAACNWVVDAVSAQSVHCTPMWRTAQAISPSAPP